MKFLFSVILCTLTYSVSLAQTYTPNHTKDTLTLAYFLDTAKKNSPLLKDLRNQVAANQVDSLRLLAGFRPQVNANSGGLYAPAINGYGYASAITNEHTFNALMSANQAIVSKKNINAQVEAINLLSQSVGNASKISEQDLKKAITSQYITTYGDWLQYKFNQTAVQLLTQEDALLKKLTRDNIYHQSDYLTFLVTLKQQQLQLLQSDQQYKNDYATLNYLAGIEDTRGAALQRPVIEKAMLPHAENSIFFRQYKLDSLKLINGRELIDFSYKPKISITADGGYNSDFMGQAYKNFGVSAGFTFSMPIYDGGQRKMQYRKLSLQEETRQNYKAFFNVQYRQQIAQLNQQIDESDSLLNEIESQLTYSKKLIEVDVKLLQTGDIRVVDMLLAFSNYLTINNLFNTTTINKWQLINQLNYWNR